MTTDNAFQQSLARRSFLRKAGATGLTAAGGAALLRADVAALAAPRAEANLSFTLNDMPLPSDKVVPIGPGIDMSQFPCQDPGDVGPPLRALAGDYS